ncbi:MAG: EAL domain-containing protein, partial [Steroidobacterales bacterium]
MVRSRYGARGHGERRDEGPREYAAHLANLQRLPVDENKIDRSFVPELEAGDADDVIVRSTINLGLAMQIKVVPEGVEIPASWDVLANLGCHLLTGRLPSSQPLPENGPIGHKGSMMATHFCVYRHAAMAALAFLASCIAFQAPAAPAFTPIDAAKADETITLDGHSLSIEQIVDAARHGAKVELSADAQRRQQDNYGLLLEATAEGISVYWFNRATGDQRETVLFVGDAMSGANKANVERMQDEAFHRGALAGF